MNLTKLRGELAELRALAAKKRRADICLPMPEWLNLRREAWRRELEAAPCAYSYLLENLDSAPKALLKPEYEKLASDETGCQQLYELVKG